MKRGRPEKEAEERREAPITFRARLIERELLGGMAARAGYRQRALFIYDLVTSLIAQERFTFLLPGEPAEDLRRHYKNSSTNLNQLKRDFYYLAERGINAESERKALRAELKEHAALTKALHRATFRKQVSLPVTMDFWNQLDANKDNAEANLLPTAKVLKAMRDAQKGSIEEDIATLDLRLHELKAMAAERENDHQPTHDEGTH